MSKKISVSVALAITIIAMTVTFSVTMILSMRIFNSTVNQVTQKQVLNNKIAEIDAYVRGNYYGEIDEDYLGDRVARGYMDGLRDAGSTYYTAAEYTELQEIARGDRVGIGIEVTRDANGYYLVAKVYPSSPAADKGITVGTRLVQIDGVDARSYSTVRSLQMALYKEPGTTVELNCIANNEEVNYSIQRVNYTAPTLEPLQMVDGIAYIRINSFGSTTASEFDYAVRDAIDQGAVAFVFDVRGVTGGSYDEVYKVIDLACGQGVIARAEYKNNTTKVLSTSDEENRIDLPMVVVVNGSTSGPAELFAASIREISGGQLVGETTAGVGMLQSEPQRMSDGSAVVVTVAKMLTGKNNVAWNGVGFNPDVPAAATVDEFTLYNIDPRTDRQVVQATALARSLARADGSDVTGTAPSTPESTPSSTSDPAPEDLSGGEDSLPPDDSDPSSAAS